MKRFFTALILISFALPALAKQESNTSYPLQMTQQNKEVKVYSQSGSLQGYVKPVGGNQYKTYNKYHQYSGRYKQEGNKIKQYNR